MAEEPEDKPKLRPAEENVWYVIATLNGKPGDTDYSEEIREKNRLDWNAWVSQRIELKFLEIKQLEEVRPNGDQRIGRVIEKLQVTPFAVKAGENFGLPHPNSKVDFSNILFCHAMDFEGFVFPSKTTFRNAVFLGGANFKSAFFVDTVNFMLATFEEQASFETASFFSSDFSAACFKRIVNFDLASFADLVKYLLLRFDLAYAQSMPFEPRHYLCRRKGLN